MRRQLLDDSKYIESEREEERDREIASENGMGYAGEGGKNNIYLEGAKEREREKEIICILSTIAEALQDLERF